GGGRGGGKVLRVCGTGKAGGGGGGGPGSDEERIKGVWRATAAETGGEAVPKELIDTLKPVLTFSGEKVTWKVNPPDALVRLIEAQAGKPPFPKEAPTVLRQGEEGGYHLDPTKTPRAVDMVYLGPIRKTMPGLYALEGDTLKISMIIDPDRADQRPTDFATRPGVLQVTITFRRQPPENPR